MALSDYEKTALEEIARSLERDYPKLASRLGPATVRPRPAVAGIFGALVGCLVLLVAVAVQTLLLGVLGFAIMGAGAYLATKHVPGPRFRRRGPAPSTSSDQQELW